MTRAKSGWWFFAIWAVAFAVALFVLVYPVYVIRPFRAQGARELMAALAVTRFRPVVAVVCSVAAIAALVWYWQARPRWWRRGLAVLGTLTVCAAAVLTRINIYELMFHPLGAPAFADAGSSKLDRDEMVLAIREGGEARAYPIRIISYHHIVNDTLGGVPIVATY